MELKLLRVAQPIISGHLIHERHHAALRIFTCDPLGYASKSTQIGKTRTPTSQTGYYAMLTSLKQHQYFCHVVHQRRLRT